MEGESIEVVVEESTALPAPEPVVASEPTVAPTSPARLKQPKWEMDSRERVRAGIRKFSKPLADFIARDVNEADTRFLVTDFLCETLGYDKFSDLTAEFAIKGDFADYGLRVDRQLVALIEVKRVTTKLSARHLKQVEDYGVREGVEWLWLTNGAQWQVYHLEPVIPIVVDLVVEIDLLSPDQPSKKADTMLPLTRDGMKHGLMDQLWKAKKATSPKAIARVLTSPAVVTAVRRELRRETDYTATDEEILGLVRTTLRTDCL